MSDGRKLILSSFTGCKKRKAWNKTTEKYMPEERKQNLVKQTGDHIAKQEEWLEVRSILRR